MIKVDAKKRSKRLRKKLYLEEFKVLGFEIDLKFVDSASEEDLDKFFDEFLKKAIEANDLVFGGGGTKEGFSGFIVPAGRYDSSTEEHRKLVSDWLGKSDLLESHETGELIDANLDL
ncbi:MAG: 50S ribosome-binding protein YggL [Endozoicomonas sp.]